MIVPALRSLICLSLGISACDLDRSAAGDIRKQKSGKLSRRLEIDFQRRPPAPELECLVNENRKPFTSLRHSSL
jgi:hypothetical protein